jgi:hypothetical protein
MHHLELWPESEAADYFNLTGIGAGDLSTVESANLVTIDSVG